MQVKIEVIEGTVHVVGPYSTENNDVWRSLGGKFTGGRWVLPDNETTRQKIAKMFGAKSEEVEVFVPNERLTDGEIVQIGGYVLAQRRGRDRHEDRGGQRRRPVRQLGRGGRAQGLALAGAIGQRSAVRPFP